MEPGRSLNSRSCRKYARECSHPYPVPLLHTLTHPAGSRATLKKTNPCQTLTQRSSSFSRKRTCPLLLSPTSLLIKLKVVRSAPIAYSTIGLWALLLFFILFIPRQFCAPSGPVRVFSYVNQIAPNVSGQVIEVPASPNQPVQKSEVLFRIDPRPYQFEADELEATPANGFVANLQLRPGSRVGPQSVSSPSAKAGPVCGNSPGTGLYGGCP